MQRVSILKIKHVAIVKRDLDVKVEQVNLLTVQPDSTARVVSRFLAAKREVTVTSQHKNPVKLLARFVKQEDFNLSKHKFHAIKHVHWESMVTLKGKRQREMLAYLVLSVKRVHASG